LVAGCQEGGQEDAASKAKSVAAAKADAPSESLEVAVRRGVGAIASHADRGTLFGYAAQAPVEKGAYKWHGIELSEANAIRAVAERSMVVQAPNGAPIRLDYVRHHVHANGNWTFVGRPAGAKAGDDAVITFGEKAVFGSIPNGSGPRLEVTTLAGRTYLIEADPTKVADVHPSDDVLTPTMLAAFENSSPEPASAPRMAAVSAQRAQAAGVIASNAGATASNTVDLVLGYTTAFANRLGGTAQAETRLQNMVDTTNDALANSAVAGQVRLVQAVQVDYTDGNTNRAALFELTGVTCSNAAGGQLPDGGVTCSAATRPAALAPLAEAREDFGADLVALVRTFQAPEQGGCGTAWVNGNGQTEIDGADAAFGFAVVSDSGGNAFPDPEGGTCRNDNLAHELGHNLGLQHDRESASRGTDSNGDGNNLDPAEFGRFPYAFGYVAPADAGNFYDVMAPRRNGLTSVLMYSNPQISIDGFPVGAADADNARALRQTIPMVAAFRTNVLPFPSTQRNDFNGEAVSDILWRNGSTGQAQIWLGANATTQQAMPIVGSAWRVATTGDFNGDGASDILWRNSSTGQNTIWLSGNNTTQQAVAPVGNQAWTVVGAGDFDGDGAADILWRNTATGQNLIWRSGNSAAQIAVTTVGNQAWRVAGVGDFDADGRADILWRNSQTGANLVWSAASSSNQHPLSTAGLGWSVAGVNDFDGDGSADILWRNGSTGQNLIWRAASSANQQPVATVGNLAWRVAATGDYDGDGVGDILWRNTSNGQNLIWRSANSAAQTVLPLVGSQAWVVAG